MTITEIKSISNDLSATGDTFVDKIYDLDKSSIYYRFLYKLIRNSNPQVVVELGVCTGHGTVHCASASANTVIIAVDPNPLNIDYILDKYHNIKFYRKLSTDRDLLMSIDNKSIDIVFFDTEHTYEQVRLEVEYWLPKIKDGGILLFDDICYNSGMIKFWDELKLSKISLPHLHWTGFGAAINE